MGAPGSGLRARLGVAAIARFAVIATFDFRAWSGPAISAYARAGAADGNLGILATRLLLRRDSDFLYGIDNGVVTNQQADKF